MRCRSSAVSFLAGAGSSCCGLAASLVPPPKAISGFSSSHRRWAERGVRGPPPLGDACSAAGSGCPAAVLLLLLPLPASLAGWACRLAALWLAAAGRARVAAALAGRCAGRPLLAWGAACSCSSAVAAGGLGLQGVGMRDTPCASRDTAGGFPAAPAAVASAAGGALSAGLVALTGAGARELLAAAGAAVLLLPAVAGRAPARLLAPLAEVGRMAAVPGRAAGLHTRQCQAKWQPS